MAKEEGAVEAQEQESKGSTQILMDALQTLMARPLGVAVKVCGEEQLVTLPMGLVKDLAVDSAWIRLTRGSCVLRTREIKDRNLFWEWVMGGGQGVCSAHFYKLFGAIEAVQEQEKKKGPFRPRSRYAQGRTPKGSEIVSVE